MNRTQIIKNIDRIFGPFLMTCIPDRPLKNKMGIVESLLIIRPGGLGDAVLLLPALKAVKNQNPNLRIDVLCEPRNDGVFKAVSFIDNIFNYQQPSSLLSILVKKYDMVLETEQSHYLSAVITKLTNSKTKIGFKTNGREKCYSLSAEYRHDRYEAVTFWKLFKKAGILNKDFSFDYPYFKPPPKSLSQLVEGKKYICIFPGASVNQRLWPADRWATVIDTLYDSNWDILLLGHTSEKKQCKKIKDLCKTNRVINLCMKLNLLQTTWIFSGASLLISIDSGLLHLGVACNTPTVSLFGPGIAKKWAPSGIRHIVINKNVHCSPCTKFGETPDCNNNFQCMLSISTKNVIDATMRLLHLT